jgi:hypothetical protein
LLTSTNFSRLTSVNKNIRRTFVCNKGDSDIFRAFLNRVIPVQVSISEHFHWFFWRKFLVVGPEHMVNAVFSSAKELKKELRARQAARERRLNMDHHAEAFNERKQRGVFQ